MKKNLFKLLRKQEEDFLEREFITFSYGSIPIEVNIGGVILKLTPDKKVYGLNIFKPSSYKSATFIRNASLSEKREFLLLFPRVLVMMTSGNSGIVVNDNRFNIEEEIKIFNCDGLTTFDFVHTRFTGNFFICESSKIINIKQSNELRNGVSNLNKELATKLSDEISHFYLKKIKDEELSRIPPDEQRIRNQLERAGGELKKFKKVGNKFIVDYSVSGFNNTCTVNQNDLSVTLAGICLGHYEENMVSSGLLDLNSLVSVTREAVESGQVVRGNYE